ESEEEKHDSPIFDGTYACHDSISCGIKYGKSACNISTDSQFKEVFMSALYTENYFKGSLLLGYTIKKYHPNHAMYLLYFPSQISASLVCQLKAVGWIMKEVERIPVPWDGHLYGNFDDQFTKLQMWSLIEFDTIIYIDSDAIVLQRIDNLFKMITPYAKFEFAAAPDVLDWQILTKFNAGTHIQLPLTYNFNLALMEFYPHLWPILFPDIKVIHFTVQKPFLTAIPHEMFKEPFEIWDSMYSEMDK
ncbi:10742_t:CDS:2, partial [Gigaspora margarita]